MFEAAAFTLRTGGTPFDRALLRRPMLATLATAPACSICASFRRAHLFGAVLFAKALDLGGSAAALHLARQPATVLDALPKLNSARGAPIRSALLL